MWFVSAHIRNQYISDAVTQYQAEDTTANNKETTATVSIEENRSYLIYEDFYNSDDFCFFRNYTYVGLYDALIVASAPCGMDGALTTLGVF